MSQNNRAFRSNPNSSTILIMEGENSTCHKITEPSAQIPTHASAPKATKTNKISHKITEPSAQIPTKKSGLSSCTMNALDWMSQNNRAFRSNPNLYRQHLMFHIVESQNNRAFRSNPNFSLEIDFYLMCGKKMSQNNRAFRSNPNEFSDGKSERFCSFEGHKITEPSAQIPT